MNSAERLKIQPQIQSANWVAPNATVLGDVTLGERTSVWFGAVIRGDSESISVGADTNLQDQVLLHADPGFPCCIGSRVTVGHGAIVHGAKVEDDVLVGMRATILNGAIIGAGSIVAAGSLVTEGKVFPPNSLIVGVPARSLRQVTAEESERQTRGWRHYVELSATYANNFRKAD